MVAVGSCTGGKETQYRGERLQPERERERRPFPLCALDFLTSTSPAHVCAGLTQGFFPGQAPLPCPSSAVAAPVTVTGEDWGEKGYARETRDSMGRAVSNDGVLSHSVRPEPTMHAACRP